jgi:hypothetical protein
MPDCYNVTEVGAAFIYDVIDITALHCIARRNIYYSEFFETAQAHTCALEPGTLFQQCPAQVPRAPSKAAVESLH